MLPQHTSSSPKIWIICTASSWLWQYFMINQTKVYICSNSPVLNRWLLFWEESSCPPVFSLNLLFWDDPGLNVRSLFILQVSLTFYKLTVKTLAVSKLGGCRCCSWSPSLSWAIDPSQQKHFLFGHYWKKCQEQVCESTQFAIFKQGKVLCN